MYSAIERIKIWSEFNECGVPMVKDSTDSSMLEYNCTENREVKLMVLKGVGHDLGKKWAKKTDRLIIEFFLRHKKQGLTL